MSKPVYSEVLGRMRYVSVAPVGVIGESGRWQKLILKGKKGTLTFNSLKRERPGDTFSNMTLGFHNLFWNVRAEAADRRKVVKEILKELK